MENNKDNEIRRVGYLQAELPPLTVASEEKEEDPLIEPPKEISSAAIELDAHIRDMLSKLGIKAKRSRMMVVIEFLEKIGMK